MSLADAASSAWTELARRYLSEVTQRGFALQEQTVYIGDKQSRVFASTCNS
jgi:hypothetical protein